jgi:sulfopyruvate decarboxylase subunit beta
MHEGLVLSILKDQGIDIVSSVPCDKAKDLCFMIPGKFNHIGLTREEDGIGVSAGAFLAGKRPAMVIQSSGLGNSLNALMSLTRTYSLPLPILASWRGVQDEVIPAQVPFNAALPKILEATGIPFTVIRDGSDLEKIGDVISDCFEQSTPHIGLILPKVWEGDEFCRTARENPPRQKEIELYYRRSVKKPTLTRFEAIQVITRHLDRQAVVSNIGVPSKELYAARDRPLNFYMLGSYTQASPIGLGLCQGTARDVWVIDGDGSILGTGILPVIGTKQPGNLTIFCLDNGAFGSTGNQLTPAYDTADLELMAIASGFTHTWKTGDDKELETVIRGLGEGPNFVHVLLKPGNADVRNIPCSPIQIRDRFRTALQA